MSKKTKLLEFSKKEREIIYERDNYSCVFCGSTYALGVAHYIPRSKSGLGIKENGVLACQTCHYKLDFGTKKERAAFQQALNDYLTNHYGIIDIEKLKYRKW